MKVEHITLGGNSSVRDTNSILPQTIELLKDFQIKEGVKTIPFPRTGFSVKVTSAKEGAIFDIVKNSHTAIMNVCCFREEDSLTMLNHVRQMSKLPFLKDPRPNFLPQWIYSIPINPFALTQEELMVAGEVELYIYYSLWLARQ
jgi:hypothetical protein